jgi:hypothetical protein
MHQHAKPSRRWTSLAIAVILVWYPALTLLLGFSPAGKRDFSMAFTSMAEHMLHGHFDVDADAIGAEGFESGGRTVAYFGVFCALLRVPLVLIPGWSRVDITWWSCLAGTMLGAWYQTRAVLLVWGEPSAGAWSRRDWLAAGLLLSVLLGGQHIPFLHTSLFDEPVAWASAQAFGFVWLAARSLMAGRGFDTRTLCGMAVWAGLSLLTRASFGIGLLGGLGLLMLVTVPPRRWGAPALIVASFVILTGIINQDRWGNPLVFADYARYGLSLDVAPERLGHLAAYGTFNPRRIWLTGLYYFLPVWVWIRADGHVLFTEAQAAMMDAMELPAGSFFLTDGLVLFLAVAGVAAIRDRARAALLAGLAVQPFLILCAISTAHRYRMEFQPFFFTAALFGLTAISNRQPATRRVRAWVVGVTLLGVVASHAMAVWYAHAPLGPGEFYLERDGLRGTWSAEPR